jgi:hypothetical protein
MLEKCLKLQNSVYCLIEIYQKKSIENVGKQKIKILLNVF